MTTLISALAAAIRESWTTVPSEAALWHQQKLWEIWQKIRPTPEAPNDQAKVDLLCSLTPEDRVVLLNATACRITDAIWEVLKRVGEKTISHAALVETIQAGIAHEKLETFHSQYYFGGLLFLGYLLPDYDCVDCRLCYRINLGGASAETLRNQMFGFRTSIPGFDELFGGALLLQRSFLTPEEEPTRHQMNGRMVLVEGPFGSGKSILTWRMAADIVAEGGLVFFCAPEQTLQECLYAIVSLDPAIANALESQHRDSLKDFEEYPPPQDQGCLIFMQLPTAELPRGGRSGTRESEILNSVKALLAKKLTSHNLRVFMLDPVNALLDAIEGQAGTNLRSQTSQMIREAKEQGVNLWMTCEKNHEQEPVNHFFENLADTIVKLGRQEVSKHVSQSIVEITKSRFQGQLSGRHRLIIERGKGVRIHPSIQSFHQLLPPAPAGPPETIDWGIQGIESTLGQSGRLSKRIIVVTGPGRLKTVTGLHFLVGDWWPNPDSKSVLKPSPRLLISELPLGEMQEIAKGIYGAQDYGRLLELGLGFLEIPNGLADPGEVLASIRLRLEKETRANCPVQRVTLATLSRMEEATPSLQNNELFGLMLLKLFRAYGVSTMIVNSDETEYRISRLRDVVLDECDVRVDFYRTYYFEREQTMISIDRTPASDHKRSFYCLNRLESGILAVEPSIFRLIPGSNRLAPIPTKIFLHAETENHRRYHQNVVETLKNFRHPELVECSRHNFEIELLSDLPKFANRSQKLVDDAQIVQLDEFELPHPEDATDGPLELFALENHKELVDRRRDDLRSRVQTKGDTPGRDWCFFAVPYYVNCSFMALFQDGPFQGPNPFFDGDKPKSPDWKTIVEFVIEKENELALNQFRSMTPKSVAEATEPPPRLVFSCPVYSGVLETYNALFFEILESLQSLSSMGGECAFLEWMTSDNAVVAANYFRKLCYLSHRYFFWSESKPRAWISRHWYNTLNQEIMRLPTHLRNSLKIVPMPEGVTTWGEWYLAIPKGSHSPQIGLEVIHYLCSPRQEDHRRQEGVGLPTTQAFYNGDLTASVSPYCQFQLSDLNHMFERGFRRSRIACYGAIRGSLSAHLRWILELPMGADPKVDVNEDNVSQIMESFRHELRVMRAESSCKKCRFAGRPPNLGEGFKVL